MANTPSIYHSDDVFRLFTSPEWMSRRRTSPSNFYPYIEDLQRLALAYETGALEDLPKRIALSYLEHRVRSVYGEVPLSMLESMWLSQEDVNGRILPLALSMPTLRQRIEYLHRLAELLILDDKSADALAVMDVALALYSTTDEADYCDEHVRRGMGHALAKADANLARVDYDLIASLYKQHQWLDASINDSRQWDVDSVGSRFIRDVLQGVLERLGEAGAFEQATDLIRYSGEEWLSGYKRYSAQSLMQYLTAGLIRGKHFTNAEQNLLGLGFDEQDIVRLWCDYLDKLYDAGEATRLRAVLATIEHTPVWSAAAKRSDFRRPGLLTGQTPISSSDESPDRSELRDWILAQCTASLWQHEHSLACDYLDFWPSLEAPVSNCFSLLSRHLNQWRRCQSLPSLSGWRSVDLGSFSRSESTLWLAMLGRFDVLEKLVSTGAYKGWSSWGASYDATDLVHLSRVTTIEELRQWQSTIAHGDAAAAGCAYLAFRLAKQNKQLEAEKVLDEIAKEKPGHIERARLALAQGLALGVGIEHARRYIKGQCQIMERDFAGDIWTVAQALIAFDRVDDAIKLLMEDTFEHPGMPQTWVDLAGVLRRQYGAERVVEKLAPISIKFAIDIASKYATVDEEYARAFLAALMKRIPKPIWGNGLGTNWPGVVEQADEIHALCEQVGDPSSRAAVGRLVIGRDALAGMLREVVWGFGFSADSILRVLVLAAPGTVWVGGSNQSSSWPRLERKQVLEETKALAELQRLEPRDSFQLESLFYSRMGCCYLSAYPYHDLMVPLVDDLAAMLHEHPQRLWYGLYAVPAALAGLERIREALELARHVSKQLPSAFDELQEIDGIEDRIFEYCQIQIALAAPAGSERDALLADILLRNNDVDRLMQMFVYFGQQGDAAADDVLRVLAKTSTGIRWPFGNEPEVELGDIPSPSTFPSNWRGLSPSSRRCDSLGLDRNDDSEEISSSLPSTADEDWFSGDVADEADVMEVDGSATEIDWDLANQMFYHLLVAGRTDRLEQLLRALNAPDDLVRKLVVLAPDSLEGMLDVFSIGGTKGGFQPDAWPFSVLLNEAEYIDGADRFFELIAAAEQVVDTKDMTKAYQAIVERAPSEAVSLLHEELVNGTRNLDDFKRAVLLACFVPAVVRISDSEIRPAALVGQSLQRLESFFSSREAYCSIRLWEDGTASLWGRRSGVRMSPVLAYCRGLAILTRCVGQAGLVEDNEPIRERFLETLYSVLRKTEYWADSEFGYRLQEILDELEEDELIDQIVKVFDDIGMRWKVVEDVAS